MGFSKEDWVIINEALNMAAKELRRIIREKIKEDKEMQKGSTSADTSSQQDEGDSLLCG